MACSDYKPLLDPYAQGALPEDQAALLEDHLEECEPCRKSVALLRMKDEAVASALLTGSRRDRDDADRRRPLRIVLMIMVIAGLLIGGLYLFYAGIEKRLPDLAPGARTVLLSVERQPLTRVLGEVAEQAGARLSWVREDDPEPRVTLEFVQPIRVRSLIALLSRMHGATFRGPQGLPPAKPLPEDSTELVDRVTRATITYNFSDLPLRQALAYVRRLKAVNVVVHPSIPVEVLVAPVDLEGRDQPLSEALTELLEPHGLAWSITHEVVLVELR